MSEKPPSSRSRVASHGHRFVERPDLFASSADDIDEQHPPLAAIPPERRMIHFIKQEQRPRHERQEVDFVAAHVVVPARYRAESRYRSECQDDGFHDERTGTIAACDGLGSGGASQLAAHVVTKALREYTLPGHPEIPFFSSTFDQTYSDEEARRAAHVLHQKLHAEVAQFRFRADVRKVCEASVGAREPHLDSSSASFQRKVQESIENSGTTLALVRPFYDTTGQLKVVCLNVGDSRIYRRRQGQFEQVSRDHGYIQALAELGLVQNEHDDQTRFSFQQVTNVLDRLESELSFLATTDPAYRIKESQAQALTILLREFSHRQASELTLYDVGNVCLGWIGREASLDPADIWIEEAQSGDEYYVMTDQLYENMTTDMMEKARSRAGDIAAAARILCAVAGTIGIKDDDGTVSAFAVVPTALTKSRSRGVDPTQHPAL